MFSEEKLSLLKENSPLIQEKSFKEKKEEKEEKKISKAVFLSLISCVLLIILSLIIAGLLLIPRKSKNIY